MLLEVQMILDLSVRTRNEFPPFSHRSFSLKRVACKISHVGLAVTKDTRLCSVHFEPDCSERDLRQELLGSKGKHKLKPDVVPTIFLPSTKKEVSVID